MIDWQRVAELRDEVGADEFLEVAELFLEEVDEVLASLCDSAEPADLGAKLHFLKGSALNIGFSDMARHCALGEQQAAAGTPEAIDIAILRNVYQTSRKTFLDRFDPAESA